MFTILETQKLLDCKTKLTLLPQKSGLLTDLMTDSGVSELCKCSNLESIDISGVISEASIEKLGQMPNLESLIVRTNLIDDVAKKRLQEKLNRIRFHLGETPQSLAGKDGFHRMVPGKGRSTFDALEGATLESMLGPALTDELRTQLAGKAKRLIQNQLG